VPTHQEIAQLSDEELLRRMVNSHDGRFDQAFWEYFAEQISPHLPEAPVVSDLGCGPGLFLRDLSQRLPAAQLHGFDVTKVMIDYAQTLEYAGTRPVFRVCDLESEPLPLPDGGVDLVTMVAVLHVLSEPLSMCREICRILSSEGILMLQDWIRTPITAYLDRMLTDVPAEMVDIARTQLLKLFPTHNKYSIEDWLWLLKEGGLRVVDYRKLYSPHFRTFICRLD